MAPFLVVIHDVTPAFARETHQMIDELAPLVGRSLSLGVVPDWHAQWPLTSHPQFCKLLRDSADELLLHGYLHQRRRGSGTVSWLAEQSDEMNGLTRDETHHALRAGQKMFVQAFGTRASGFLPPAWQRGHVHGSLVEECGLQYVLGMFSISHASAKHSLATYTWDCGRWGALGEIGHTFGAIGNLIPGLVPTLAIHPRDIARGYWPRILKLTRDLLNDGCTPVTPSQLINFGAPYTSDAQVTV